MRRTEDLVPEIFTGEPDAHRGDLLDGFLADGQLDGKRRVYSTTGEISLERNRDNHRGKAPVKKTPVTPEASR